jgi:hypothetical protein
MKLCIVVYGCLSRSLGINIQNHNEKILMPIKRHHIDYDIYYINNNVKNIDGIEVTRFDSKEIKFKDFFEYDQECIDEIIRNKFPDYKSFFRKGYIKKHGLSPIRNAFLESKISELLKEKKDYTHAIAFCSDLWFEKEIDMTWSYDSRVIISDTNPSGGYTNGFYFGKREYIADLLDIFFDLRENAKNDYEDLIKRKVINFNIPIEIKKYRFLKIRADGSPAYENLQWTYIWDRVKYIKEDYQDARSKNT